MRKMGILHDLERKGIQPGDEIQMGKDNIGSFKY
jgi:hypothetical protein